jgi:hypothetical protein
VVFSSTSSIYGLNSPPNSELDKDKDDEIKKEESDRQDENEAKNKEANLKADSAIGLLNNVINANIGIGSELYKVASQEQKGTVSEKKGISKIFSRSSTSKDVELNTKESDTKESDTAIGLLKDAVVPSISVSSKLYDVAKEADTAIEKGNKNTKKIEEKVINKATNESDNAIGLLKDAVVPSISVGNELYNVAATGSKAIETGIKKEKADTETQATTAAEAANSAINSLKDAVVPSISVGNELYNVAAVGSNEIERVKAKADAKAETKAETKAITEANATKAANSAINSLKDAVAPSISVGNELYKVADEAGKAIKKEATVVDSAEAEFIDSIKGTDLLNSISNIFDEFNGIDDLGIEKTNTTATIAAATPAKLQSSLQGASGVSEGFMNPPLGTPSKGPFDHTKEHTRLKIEAPPHDGNVGSVSGSFTDQGGGRILRGGNPNQKYSDDNLKAQYLDTQRYNKIKDNKIINEYRNRLNENKDKVVSIKTDNKIEQLSNDIDIYNSLDFDEKEGKDETDNIIKKIRDFENDPKNPIEALELTFDDRIVFIIATFFIRYITIIMVQWCIDINIIKTFYEGFIYYAVIYIILFWFIVLFINIDNSFDVKYMNFNGIINSIRTLFYYFYMGTNGISRLLIHTSLILLLIVIPIILNIKKKPDFKDEDDQESMKILDYEERKQLSKALSLFTMFIWLFTSIIATKF